MSPANYIRGLASNIVDTFGNFLNLNHTVGDINVLVAKVNKMGFNEDYISFIETVHQYMPNGWQWEEPETRISDLCESREGLAAVREAIKKYASQN